MTIYFQKLIFLIISFPFQHVDLDHLDVVMQDLVVDQIQDHQ